MKDLLLLLAFAGGLIAGLANLRRWLAISLVLVLAAGSLGVVAWWQDANPENLSSTSALEYVFGPLMALGGFIVAKAARTFRTP